MRVTVNAAVSVDGKLSTRRREQVAISGPDDFDRVDGLRADCDGVMVGVGTVLADDPSLTVDDPTRREARRARGDPPNPARVVADSRARTPTDARVLDDEARTYLLVADAAPGDRLDALRDRGARVLRAGTDRVDLAAALAALERGGDAGVDGVEEVVAGSADGPDDGDGGRIDAGLDRLLVEGGGELLYSLFAAGLVDDLSVYVGSTVVGGREAPTLVDGEGFVDPGAFPALDLRGVERIDDGVLLRYDVPGG